MGAGVGRAAAALAAVLLVASPASAEVRAVEGVELVPLDGSAFSFSLAEGERVEREFLLRNTWAKPQTVRLSGASVGPGEQVSAPGTAPWIELPGEVRLRAGEIRTLRLAVRGDGEDRQGAVVVEVRDLRATTPVLVDGTGGVPLPAVTAVFVGAALLLLGLAASALRRRHRS